MKRGSEELFSHSGYTFSLTTMTPSKTALSLVHDFAPVICQTTFKRISSTPSYHLHYALPFQTELDLPKSNLKNEAEDAQPSLHILIPKPSTHYCQVCKERFQDYLRHTSHPLHLRKLKQLHNELNFNSLKEIMLRRQKKMDKSSAASNKPASRVYATPSKSSAREGVEETYSSGNKKSVVNHEGDLQVISLISTNMNECELSSSKSVRSLPAMK